MEPGMVFFAFLVRFALVMLFIGWIPAVIAKSKGRSFMGWWFYGGALFIVALIHSLILKPFDQITHEDGEKGTLKKAAMV